MSHTTDLYAQYILNTARRGLTLTGGEGRRVWDDTGRCYLDFGGGIAVNCLGHQHPAMLKALTEQAARIIHTSNLYYNEAAGRLAERLVKHMGGSGKIFFTNSGAESNECILKLARKAGHETGRFEFITALNSFHGRTFAGIAATGQEKLKAGFEPMLPGFSHVPYNDLAAVEAAITPRTIAVMIEGIQGEGGICPATPEYLLGLRKLTRERNIMLLVDAVQCGHFRTGRYQSYQRILEGKEGGESFQPDALSMAKSLGGGFPIGAAWISEAYENVLGPGTHNTTYGGSPLASAAANAVLDAIETEALDANIRARGDELLAGLKPLIGKSGITAVRGLGGLIGMAFVGEVAAEMVKKFADAGLLTIAAGTKVVRFLPALNVTSEEIAEGLGIVRGVVGATA
ncbi:ornithine aminotransferase [Verrucomicrobia bacterium SCGC AG-212-E04]|nr:ornithine aminotransferase [Verrucomicrobia bacterium SCGC AG-212-E04]